MIRPCGKSLELKFSTFRRGDFVYFIFQHMRYRGCEVFQAPYFAGRMSCKYQKASEKSSWMSCKCSADYENVLNRKAFARSTLIKKYQRIISSQALASQSCLGQATFQSCPFCILFFASWIFFNLPWQRGTQLVHFAEQGAVQAVFGPPGLLWDPEIATNGPGWPVGWTWRHGKNDERWKFTWGYLDLPKQCLGSSATGSSHRKFHWNFCFIDMKISSLETELLLFHATRSSISTSRT